MSTFWFSAFPRSSAATPLSKCLISQLASTAEHTLYYTSQTPRLPIPFWPRLMTTPHLGMARTNAPERLLDAASTDFATSLLPLTIRIGSASHEYKLPKALLCKQSPYFAAMFEGSFKEGEEQSTTLEEMNGEVTPQSFQMLVQWVCLGRVVFRECAPDVSITTAIELARLADMCHITSIESLMAEHIKAIILANPAPEDRKWDQ